MAIRGARGAPDDTTRPIPPGLRKLIGLGRPLTPDEVAEFFSTTIGTSESFVTSAPAHKSIAARQIVDELRHQYVLAFAASPAAGWHQLTVKTRDRDLTVRARRGYAAGIRAGS